MQAELARRARVREQEAAAAATASQRRRAHEEAGALEAQRAAVAAARRAELQAEVLRLEQRRHELEAAAVGEVAAGAALPVTPGRHGVAAGSERPAEEMARGLRSLLGRPRPEEYKTHGPQGIHHSE